VLQQLVDYSKNADLRLVLFAVLPSYSSTGSQEIISSLEPNIDLTRCLFREEFSEAASSYIIKSRSNDSRTIVNYNELPEMTTAEFMGMADKLGEKASWYHFEASLSNVSEIFPDYQ
jgi:ketohexokinase